jgi:hypothetical protein
MSDDLQPLQPLHPNLARLDATYDRIVERFALGQLDPPRANAEIAALVARDDEGTLWHKDPRTGGWLRRTRSGELVPDTPPTYGFATPTAHDVTPNPQGFDPSSRIVSQEVDESLMFAPSSLAGSTRLLPDKPSLSFVDRVLPSRTHRLVAAAAVVLVVVLVTVAVMWPRGSSDEPPVSSTTAPLTVSPPVSAPPSQPGG